MKPVKVIVEDIYSGGEEAYLTFLTALDKSLNPRSPAVLFDKFGELKPTRESLVLDAGCRDAAQACELHKRFGCRVTGIDLVADNIAGAHKRIADAGLGEAVQVVQGNITNMPFEDGTYDLLWCRDVLSHMADLKKAYAEMARILKPGGKMLIFQMFRTGLMTDNEVNELCSSVASNPDTMDVTHSEKAMTDAGLTILEVDALKSEWREYSEESGSCGTSKQLLRIARMRRNKEQYIAEFGEKTYQCELANCHWGVYQMLGKMSPRIYKLGKE